jgi:hypothetical protein
MLNRSTSQTRASGLRIGYFAEALEGRVMLSGVTLITHGYGGSAAGWVTAMGDAIAARAGPAINPERYLVTVTDPGHPVTNPLTQHPALTVTHGPLIGGGSPRTDPNPEFIILLDWSDVAGSGLLGGYARSTVDVAAAVTNALLSSSFFSDLGQPLAQLPFHLIGHSRGGSLVAEIAKDLGVRGVLGDQVTTLDPHPVDGTHAIDPANFGDSTPRHYENIQFMDDYWRSDSLEFVPDGQPIDGALNDPQTSGDSNQFESNLESASRYSLFQGGDHSNVHLWYHGTIDTSNTASDGAYTVPTSGSWYAGPAGDRRYTGYYYSRLAGGTRPAAGVLTAFGGTASTVTVTRAGTQWPNVAAIALQNPAGPIHIGDQIFLSYRYQDDDSSATITWFADQDQNPFNNNVRQLPGPQSVSNSAGILAGTYNGSTAGLTPSYRYIYAQITDAAANTRYSYLPNPVDLVTTPPVISNPVFLFSSSPHKLTLTFSDDVASSLAATDLLVQRQPSGSPFSPASVSYDGNSNTALFTFAGVLADGNYRTTLPAASVSNSAGTPLATDFVFDFFVLSADANHDRHVDFADLVVLAQNYGGSGKTFDNGDFNYDANVDFADLVILAQHYGQTLPAASSVAALPAAAAIAIPRPSTAVSVKSLFSIVPVAKPVVHKPKSQHRH